MSWFCSFCEKSFSRKDIMQRHVMSKHRNAGFTPLRAMPFSVEKCQRFQFVHPFTCMVAGMTGSGKTVWVKSFVATGSKSNQPTTREDCLVLFAVAARLSRIDGNNAKHRIYQRYSFQSRA